MTRRDAIKAFFFKSVLPVAVTLTVWRMIGALAKIQTRQM